METHRVNLEALEEPYAALRAAQPRAEARLLLSMQAYGQKTPLWVLAGSCPGRYVVVDGHKRLRVLRRLKADVAEAEVWDVPAAEALVRTYRMQQGAWNALEEGALIEELHRKSRWPLKKIAEELQRTVSWVHRRLGLMEALPATALALVQQGKLGVYSAVKYLLPLARANSRDAERLAMKLGEGDFTSRQIGQLYTHCLQGARSVQERILNDPATFLKALEASAKVMDLHLSEAQNKCLEHLRLIGNVSLGLVRRLPEVWPNESEVQAHKKLADAWRRTRGCWGVLEKTARELSIEPALELAVAAAPGPGAAHA